MKFIAALVASLLPVLAVAAKQPADEFSKYYAQISARSSSLKLTDSLYNNLTSASRDYHVAVLLTALDARFGCVLCQDFQPEWELLTRSWVRGDQKAASRLLFGTLDFDQGKTVFQQLKLQTAPIILLFHPTVGPDAKVETAPVRYEFSQGPQKAESIHSWISRHLPSSAPKPPVRRPINYVKLVTITTSVLGLITFFTVAAPYVMPVVQNRNLWAALSIIAVLLFTSGHMFNHIRKVPYVSGDGKGGISYFSGGFQNQYGMETQIVAAMYGVLSFATVSLALKVPRIADPKTQQVAVFIWTSVLFMMYSFLLSVFRMKNGGYPFWLPPF